MIALLLGLLRKKGSATKAERLLFDIFAHIKQKTGFPGFQVITEVFLEYRPLLSVISRRVGGTVYRIPARISLKQSYAILIRWLLGNANKRQKTERTIASKLANEFIDTLGEKSQTFKKREELHLLVLTNRPFLKFNEQRHRKRKHKALKR